MVAWKRGSVFLLDAALWDRYSWLGRSEYVKLGVEWFA